MPTYVYKLGDDEYVEWSSVVDAHVSYLMTREEMFDHLVSKRENRDPDYYDLDIRKINERLERADAYGTSEMGEPYRHTQWDLIGYNREGPKGGSRKPYNIMRDLRKEREEWLRKREEYRAKNQPRIDSIIKYFEDGRDDYTDAVFGAMYETGIIRAAELDHMEYRGWTFNDLRTGKYEIQYSEEVMRLFRQWNKRLGTKIFIEDDFTGAMVESISETLGVPWRIEDGPVHGS